MKGSSTRQAIADGISYLILEGFCPKKKCGDKCSLEVNLRVIRDAQIGLCDIFGKI